MGVACVLCGDVFSGSLQPLDALMRSQCGMSPDARNFHLPIASRTWMSTPKILHIMREELAMSAKATSGEELEEISWT